MTHFPDLPPLPDPTLPLRNIVQAVQGVEETLKQIDSNGKEIVRGVRKFKETVDEILSRRPGKGTTGPPAG